jgi:phage shock protein PspC (stress-responsive transcriptional regulator)
VNRRKLYRSADDRWIAGVAAGVADYFDVDPTLVRIIWLISVPMTGLLTLIAYFIMIVVVPLEPSGWSQPSPWAPGGGPDDQTASFVPPTPVAASDAGTGAPGSAPAEPTASADAAATPMATAAPTSGWQARGAKWESRSQRRGSPALIFGLLLILIGGLIAWHEIDPRLDLGLTWPIAVVIFGAVLVVSSLRLHRD